MEFCQTCLLSLGTDGCAHAVGLAVSGCPHEIDNDR